MLKNYFKLNLRLFDAGVAPAAGATAGTTAGEAVTSVAGKSEGAKPTVIYGKQDTQEPSTQAPTQAASENTQVDAETRKANFEKMIQEEYKDLFDERIHGIINKRFKESKTYENQVKAAQPILDILGQRYGVSDGDIAKLAEAIQEDESFFEDEAMEKGLTTDQLMYQKQIERENMQLRKAQQEAERQQMSIQAVAEWDRQANELKAIYPNFDWRAEMDNINTGKDFQSVLQATNNVKMAYQAVHLDEILPNAMQLAAQKAQEAMAKNIQSRNTRPSENGISSQAGVIVKSDVNKLTTAEIMEVAERVKRGEKIRF